jgi:hypothetical protein
MASRLVSHLFAVVVEIILLTNIIAPYWSNNEWRSYTFLDVGKDGEVVLQEDAESVAKREVPNR